MPNSAYSPLAAELERRRIEANLSKWEMARRVGVSRHTMTRKLSAETQFTVGEAYQACIVLGTTLQDVLDLLELTHADLAVELRRGD